MTKRVIAWVLCVVLTMSLTPGVAARAENREIERVKIANVDAAVLEDDSDPCKDGHTYEYIQWAWVMNNKGECIGVLAGFVCGVCSMVPEMEMADLTSETIEATCTEDGWIVYTASVMYEGKRYSTQKEVMLSAKGHSYGEPEWGEWTEAEDGDGYQVDAIFTCNQCEETAEGHCIMEAAVVYCEKTPATCISRGQITYTAQVKFQGTTYINPEEKVVDFPPEGHSYGEPEWTWTETEEGWQAEAVFTCTKCAEGTAGHRQTIEAKITRAVTSATCTKAGAIVYTASVNYEGKDYTNQNEKETVIPATGHSYSEPEWGEWTEAEYGDGYQIDAIFTCDKCEETEDGHSIREEAVVSRNVTNATCITTGMVIYTAQVRFQGTIYINPEEKMVELPFEGHSYGEPQWTWTETEEGCQAEAVFTCIECSEGTIGHRQTIEAKITSAVTSSTCTEAGAIVYTASVVFEGKDYTNQNRKEIGLPAQGHSYGEPEWTWTEKEEGCQAEAVFTCTKCAEGTAGHRQTIKAMITSKVTPATCAEAGAIVYTASAAFEGKKYTNQKETELPAKGHSYGRSTWTWTEIEGENGTKNWQAEAAFTCTKCGEGKDGHSVMEEAKVTSETTPATCTETGETIYTASVTFEGREYTDQWETELPAKGHSCGAPEWSWGELTDGYIAVAAFTCKECGYQETKAAAVEKITDGEYADGKAVLYLASVEFEGMLYLDRKEVQKETGETHSLKKTDAKAATCTKAGNRQYYTCTTCGKYFSDAAGTKEIAKNSWIIKAAEHSITVREKKRTAQKEGSLTYQCAVCGYVEKVLVTPRTTKTISLGSSAKLLSNPAGCTFKLDNAKKYAKYFKLNSKTGKVITSLKKLHSVKIKKSVPVKVKVGGKTYKVAVKLKIPKPSVKIIKSTTVENGVQVYHYTFKYNIKGATRVKVRAAGMNTAVLDRYLSRPKSNSESYVSTKRGSKIRFTIVAYYGKNVSEPLVVTK